jgi:hypothetical protein
MTCGACDSSHANTGEDKEHPLSRSRMELTLPIYECDDLGGVLRLTAVTLQALLRFQATTLAGFGVFFHGSYAWGHGEGLRSVGTVVRLK